jgi:hypothetical protein
MALAQQQQDPIAPVSQAEKRQAELVALARQSTHPNVLSMSRREAKTEVVRACLEAMRVWEKTHPEEFSDPNDPEEDDAQVDQVDHVE